MTTDKFLFNDIIAMIDTKFIEKGWIKIYESTNEEDDESLIYCCIVSSRKLNGYLQNNDWNIHLGREGKPSVYTSFKNGKEIHKYETYSEKSIEPFLFWRSFKFNDGYDKYIDLSEEFIFYFKLYEIAETKGERKYFYIDELGDLEEVVVVTPNLVKVKLRYLMEYISVRKVHFSICFDFMRKPYKSLTELNVSPRDENHVGSDFNYNHYIRPLPFDIARSQSWIHGKTILKHDKSKSNKFHFSPDYKYEEFIIGYDKNGELKYQSCQKIIEKYFVLTYFKKEVLNKYYNEPEKYEVTPFSVRSDFFSLKIDNNIDDYIPVFLVELGMLPHKEQLHWKQYNIFPQKGMSHSYYKTMIEGSWAENPETPDLYFKQKYASFNSKWEEKFGWEFYKPLADQDKHHFVSLHIPTTNNVKSFCDQILSLVKITIDSLNEKELEKGLNIDSNIKGISKLEKFLESKNSSNKNLIEYLRNLQDLRSGLVAHRFSKSNKSVKKAMGYFEMEDKSYIEVARTVFIGAIQTINTLELGFLKEE
jgi:hypothetical protein